MEHAFGGKIAKPDKRDYRLDLVGSAVEIPESYFTDISGIPILHQRKIPACGSHAFATLKMIQEKAEGKTNISYTPRLHWREVKAKESFYTIEAGQTINDLFNTGLKPSVCDLSVLDNNTALQNQIYTIFNPTPAQIANAQDKMIESYATINFPTFEQIKAEIYKHKAVIIIYRCGQNMYKGKNGVSSWQERDILPLSPSNFPMDSAHYVVGYGFDRDNIYFINSWSEDWGRKGIGYFRRDYMPYVPAIGTAIDKKDVTPNVVPMTWQQRFWKLINDAGVIFKDGKWVYAQPKR